METWCEKDKHQSYNYYSDFNNWLENTDEGFNVLLNYGFGEIQQPSKALFVSDNRAYLEALTEYQNYQRNDSLCKSYFNINSDLQYENRDFWFEKNLTHFEQLISYIESKDVIPFIGAGVSNGAGYPTWKDHLLQQGRTAGLSQSQIETLIQNGQFESVIDQIEKSRGENVFIQEIRDVFGKIRTITGVHLHLTDLFDDTIITTNYDKLIEISYDSGREKKIEVINTPNVMQAPEANKTTIIKLHGDVKDPKNCILSKKQYDQAYGKNSLDLNRQIPKLLSFFYQNSSLLFIGCSLQEDRTVQVFKALQNNENFSAKQHFVIEQAPENEEEMVNRNEYLAKLGITWIWFEKEQFNYIERILNLTKNELTYRKANLTLLEYG